LKIAMNSGNSAMRDKAYPLGMDARDGRETKNNHRQKKTPKFTKRAGKKTEYNTFGWDHKGIHFFNKVCKEWKKLASKNKDGTWE
jgi:hypothetical protein